MNDDNGSCDSHGLDVNEAVPESQCRRCFTGTLQEEIRQKVEPSLTTKFCPTCGKSKDD